MGILARWDSIFFVEIAHQGAYHWDKFYAFFPGYPALMRLAASTGPHPNPNPDT